MTQHADLVKNEWLSGMQVRLATATAEVNRLVLSHVTPGWEDWLTRPVLDTYGQTFYPAKESDVGRALSELSAAYQGDYVFATAPHDESKCPFRHGPVVAMQPTDVKPSVSA